jgi:hypothetical protein
MSAVMTDYKYPHGITGHSIQEMIRKATKIRSPKIALSNRKRIWPGTGLRD